MNRKMRRAYVDGCGTARAIAQADALTLEEILAELDPERADPLLNPWRGSGSAAIRRSLGH